MDWIKSLQEFPYDPTPIQGWNFGMTGRQHTEETKRLMRKYHTPEEKLLAERENDRRYASTHQEQIREYKKKWDEKNKQKKKEYAKLYYERNKEEFARRSREQWERNNK